MFSVSDIVGLTLDYRNPVRTAACIRSMVDAGIKKIVVVDNSADLIETGLVQRHNIAGATIVELVQKRNLGFSAGVNVGLAEIQNRWPDSHVLLLNNDALIEKMLPSLLLTSLLANPTAALAYPVMQQQGVCYSGAWYQPLLGLISAKRMPFAMRYASGCCQLIATNRIPGPLYDERFFMYGEDVALAWKMHTMGFQQLLTTTCTVHHEGSAISRNGSLFYETLIVDSHLRLISVLAADRPIRFMLYSLIRCMVLPVRALIRALRLRRLTPLHGLVAGFARALQEKRGPPEQRTDSDEY